jgi:hypothetical protein
MTNSITITGQVSDQHLLSAQVPDSVPPGPVTIVILPASAHEDVEQRWMAGVAREWADELNDAQQDIYTLNDGDPVSAT